MATRKPPLRRTSTTTYPIVIFAHDPGPVNYGYAVIRVDGPKTITVLEHGKFQHTFASLKRGTSVTRQTENYLGTLEEIYERHGVNICIAERFMMRLAGGAVTIELVNQMLGALRAFCWSKSIGLKMIPSSEWKNPIKSMGILLPDVYKSIRPVTAHQLDAALIGTYGSFILRGVKFNDPKMVLSVIDKVKKCAR